LGCGGAGGCEFCRQGVVFFLRRVERVGKLLVFRYEGAVGFAEGCDFFVEGGELGGARLEVGDLLFEGFDDGVLVCSC
jgi:hypothetical protein